MALISIREFARRSGCSTTAVQRAARDGNLKAHDGKLDEDLVGSTWRAGKRQGGKAQAGKVAAKPGETPADAAARIVGGAVELLSIADAEQIKENYTARLRQLEYDQKVGAVVAVADVASVVGAQFAAVRTALLSIPAEAAPEVHRCKTVAEVQDKIMRRVVQALEHLAYGAAGAAG